MKLKMILSAVTMLALGTFATAQEKLSSETYRVFDGNGNASSLEAIIKTLDDVDVLFLGEQHDDSVGHAIESEVFRRVVEEYSPKRPVALSMEMFERDVQIVLNEYLQGQITETHFLASSRPWANYKTDYRPLVELAREKRLDVIAANAPRRYVNMVSRGGRGALDALSKQARAWLAPLPYGDPSEAYAAKFKRLMADSPQAQSGLDRILASQTLWDATMGNSLANYLKAHHGALVVHLNGGFHSESRLGAVEQLLKYRPRTRVLAVNIRYEDDFTHFDPARDRATGDFVILTDPKQPRSR